MFTADCQLMCSKTVEGFLHTVLGEFGPDTTDTRQDSLAAESSLGTDLTSEVCDLTGEIL